MPPTNKPLLHTYTAGENLAHRAQLLGKLQWFNQAVAAQMHAIGALGPDESLDGTGSLCVVEKASMQQPEYGTLENLFEQPPEAPAAPRKPEQQQTVLEPPAGGSLGAAIFGIVKGTVGPAILYLPHGFWQSGYAIAIPSMMVATAVFIYSSYRLLECWSVEKSKNERLTVTLEQWQLPPPRLLTYPELARRALGPYASLVQLGIAALQFGVCLTYLIFVPQNLKQVAASFGWHVHPTVFLWSMVLVEIPLAWIADIRKLTVTNIVATLLIAVGLLSVLTMAIEAGFTRHVVSGDAQWRTHWDELPACTNAWYLFVGTSFFMMEGSITLLVPLQEAIHAPEDRRVFARTNQMVTSGIVLFYCAFSGICCLGLGPVRTALTASLPGAWGCLVQLAYSIAVVLTFPLQAFPAMQVTCQAVRMTEGWSRRVLATVLVLLLGLVAVVAIDYLGNVVSILGSLFGIPLALVFPPLMHNQIVKDKIVMNYVVMVIGFGAMAAASVATAVSWDKGAEGE